MKRLLSLFVLATSLSVSAQSLVLNMELSPAGSFQARTEKISGNVVMKGKEVSSERIEIPVNSLKTENDLRDNHLWKHLKYDKFQKAVLTDLRGKDGKATAQLEVAGVKKPIKISYKEDGDKVVAKFNINADDFKLEEAEYLGVGVEKEVKAEVTMPYKRM